jgi:hypothetical protein
MPMNETTGELKVFISHSAPVCGDCGHALAHGAWITLVGERGALCLSCADLDHLEFLPPGDAALTRRARKHSALCAVVLKWSRARKRYERQGLLVEDAALARAEAECLADAAARARAREREAERRSEADSAFIGQFAGHVRALYPGCPAGAEHVIAAHACRKYSGRVGRSAAAKALDDAAVRLAVGAHVRHVETPYDALLGRGADRHEARQQVGAQVRAILETWQAPGRSAAGEAPPAGDRPATPH